MKPLAMRLKYNFRNWFVFLISAFSVFVSHAQTLTFDQTSDEKHDRQFVDSCIAYYAEKGAKQLGADTYVSESFYEEHAFILHQAIDSILSKEFLKINKALSTQVSKQRQRIRDKKRMYANAIQVQVMRALKENITLKAKLKERDENDRILRFHQEVEIKEDGNILVSEYINIFNATSGNGNDLIKRGIVRDFPTMYYSKYGIRKDVGFRIKSLSRNGERESFHTEKLDNGIRIFAGTADYFLSQGVHRYVLVYETDHQIIHHPDKDEFYWNVNGTGWNFTMDKVSCNIQFPSESHIKEMACYTGIYGANQTHCTYQKEGNNSISFSTNKRLLNYEGLTVAAAIQKGITKQENVLSTAKKFAKDNLFLLVPYGVLLAMLIIYTFSWVRYGRDPQRGVIMPRFEPNPALSPADMGYAYSQKFDPELFSAAVIDMAVHHCIDISVGKSGLIFKSPTYTFRKKNEHLKAHDAFRKKYNFDADDLDGQTMQKGVYNKKIASIYSAFERHIKTRVEQQGNQKSTFSIFSRNDNYIGLGILLSVFLLIFCIVGLGLFKPPLRFIIHTSIVFVAIVVLQILFSKWMRAYTLAGRRMVDEIEGFRMYLNTTEQHVFDKMNPPEQDLKLFEKYLPFAVALGVENSWSKRFESQLNLAQESTGTSSFIRSNFSSSSFSSSFASSFATGMASTVASASTPPSSSSGGSSGGGFSGGGGGGGGGGGW